MGDPRRLRKKYKGPGHPWQRTRINEERIIKKEYGLKNKKEIWKAASELRRINSQAKKLIRDKAKDLKQAIIGEKQLLDRLFRYGLVDQGAHLEDVLSLNIKNILNRRLQTIVFKSGMVLTSKQARQLILHGHIFVDGKKISVPSYVVSRDEQWKITFNPKSSFASEEHSERAKKIHAVESAKNKKEVEEKVELVGELSEEQLEKVEKELVVAEVES